MKPYVIREATLDDAHKIAPLLRWQDRREVRAVSGEEPEAILPRAFAAPKGEIIFAETTDGEPILIAGIRKTSPTMGAIWLLGTPLLEQYTVPAGREALRYVRRWQKQHQTLWNVAWAGNDLHVRWLEFLGFTILDRFEQGGHQFIPFVRNR